MFQIVCIYMIIFLRGQTYINIFIVYICPDENSVYFYLSCVPSYAILRGMIACNGIGLLQNANAYPPPPRVSPKNVFKGIISNFPISKHLFFPAYFFDDNSLFTVVFINCLSTRVSKVLPMTSKTQSDRICYPYHGIQLFFS